MTVREFNEKYPIDGLEVVGDIVLSLKSNKVLQAIPNDQVNSIPFGTSTTIVEDITIDEENITWGEITISLDLELSPEE